MVLKFLIYISLGTEHFLKIRTIKKLINLNKPLITIGITSFNSIRAINRAVNSALEQYGDLLK